MSARTAIRAVTLDAAGTLLFPEPSVGAIYQEVMAEHGLHLDPAGLERGFRKAMKETPKQALGGGGESRERAYWRSIVSQAIRAQANLPPNFDTLFEALWNAFAEGSRWRLNSDAIEFFDTLDQRGIPFALLTNWDQRVRQVIVDHGISHRFAGIFISSEIGIQKPDPAIFDHAARGLGCPPEALLHIGDDPDQDVAGAVQSGWKAIHLTQSPIANEHGASSISRLLDAIDHL